MLEYKYARTTFNVHPFRIFQRTSIACYVAPYGRSIRIGKDKVEAGSKFLRLRNLSILLSFSRHIKFGADKQTLGNTVVNP